MILDKLNNKLVEVVKNNKATEKSVEISEEILNQVHFEINDEESHGDYSTSCALKLAKTFSMNPREVAESLVEHLALPSIKSLAVEGAGSINAFLIHSSGKKPLIKRNGEVRVHSGAKMKNIKAKY